MGTSQIAKNPDEFIWQIKKLFLALNTGYQDEHSEIFCYNGGLFKPDEVLDSVVISDGDALSAYQKACRLWLCQRSWCEYFGAYFWKTVLTEIDEIKAELNGEKVDKSTSKRKKDGVFYTPKYITSYIVQNTVGKLCADKRRNLALSIATFMRR